MSNAVIIRIVYIENDLNEDILTLYYASGRIKTYRGFENFPVCVNEWSKKLTLIVDEPRGKCGRFRRWE